jgi:hypothetical protein
MEVFMATHATATIDELRKELKIETKPVLVTMGVPATTLRPRPDLAGLRMKTPNHPEVYLIDPDGYRRWIPNTATYNNLFRGWDGIISDIDVDEIALGPALTDGAALAKADNNAAVYLVSNNMKRWIVSSAAMDKYDFNWQRIYVLPHVFIDFIPTGPSLA